MVVQLFKYIDTGMTKFVQLWRKLYIFLQIQLQMNLKPKHSVSMLYIFSLRFYSFSIVVQLSKILISG